MEEFYALGEQSRKDNRWSNTDLIVLLTARKNEENWFSASDDKRRVIWIQTSDFEWIIRAPLHACIAMQIIENFVEMSIREQGYTLEDIAHNKPRGCINDMCWKKKDLRIKMRSGDICEDCLDLLEKCGATPELFKQVVPYLDTIRHLSTSTSKFRAVDSGMEWPSPIALTKHRAHHATNRSERFRELLNEFDSIVRLICYSAWSLASVKAEIPARPSMGWWVDQLSKIPSEIPETTHIAKKVLQMANQHLIVKRRNEQAHNWEGVGADRGSDLTEVLLQIEDIVRPFFSRFRFVTPVGGVDLVDGHYLVSVFVIEGTYVDWPKVIFKMKEDPVQCGLTSTKDNTLIYIFDQTESKFSKAEPFMKIDLCAVCKDRRLLLSDGNMWIDGTKGHRFLGGQLQCRSPR